MPEVKKLRCANITKTLKELSEELKSGLCSELVCEDKKLNDRVVLLCFEQYYFRCSNYVSLTVMLVDSEDEQEATIIGFGGGGGWLNISWGANKSFADNAVNILSKFGFTEI
ncbi:MAG: DUF6054 family protein [Candidatus Coproplasma sp.]